MSSKISSRRLSFESVEHRRMLTTLIDLDGDSDLDLLGGVSWYENVNGFGKFEPHQLTNLDADEIVVTEDFDNDGDIDIFTGSGQLFWNRGGEPLFGEPESVDLGALTGVENLTTFDLGNDSDQDIIVRTYDSASRSRSFAILENSDGNGTFEVGQFYQSSDFDLGEDLRLYAADDADGSGRVDLLASYVSGNPTHHVLSVLSIQADGSFTESNVAMRPTGDFPSDSRISGLLLADINSDSRPDILGSTFSSLPQVGSTVAYWNSGDLDFSSNAVVSTNVIYASGSVFYHRMTDVDRDGDLDAVIRSRYFGQTVFSLQRESGDFWKENVDGAFVSCECEIGFWDTDDVGDINGDGVPDFVKLVLDRRQDTYEIEWYDSSANTQQGIIDATQRAIRTGSAPNNIDLDRNGIVTNDDLLQYLHDRGLVVGDVNLDGRFNSTDLIKIFQIGEFEDGIAGNSSWSDGDWNSDGEFTSDDLTFAFTEGGYQQPGLLSLTRGSILNVESPANVRSGVIDDLADSRFSMLGMVQFEPPTAITFTFDVPYTITEFTIYNDLRGSLDFSDGIEHFELVFLGDDNTELGRFAADAVHFFDVPVQSFDVEDIANISSVVLNVGPSQVRYISAIEIGFWGFPSNI